jgi:DedD protein
MGAVALTILAVVILPLVLDKGPPPAGPLNIQMPSGAEAMPAAPEFASASEPADQPADKPDVEMASPASAAQKSDKASSVSSVPAKTNSRAGDYAVQVGAFADAANINRIKSKIKSLGLPAYTDKLGNTTRVRAGPFKDKATAEKAAAKLAAAGLPVKLEGP